MVQTSSQSLIPLLPGMDSHIAGIWRIEFPGRRDAEIARRLIDFRDEIRQQHPRSTRPDIETSLHRSLPFLVGRASYQPAFFAIKYLSWVIETIVFVGRKRSRSGYKGTLDIILQVASRRAL